MSFCPKTIRPTTHEFCPYKTWFCVIYVLKYFVHNFSIGPQVLSPNPKTFCPNTPKSMQYFVHLILGLRYFVPLLLGHGIFCPQFFNWATSIKSKSKNILSKYSKSMQYFVHLILGQRYFVPLLLGHGIFCPHDFSPKNTLSHCIL